MKKISAVILAAGLSTRFGAQDKLLHPYRGRPLLEWTLRTITTAEIIDPVVVIGPHDEPKQFLVSRYALRVVENPTPTLGMSSSLRLGVAQLPAAIDGFLVCLGDMPDVTVGHLMQLADCFENLESDAIVAPCFQGERGHPVLFGNHYRADFAQLQGDEGARQILRGAGSSVILREMPDNGVLRDIDTLNDAN